MEYIRSKRLGNAVQNVEFERNIRLERIVSKIEKVLIANGYQKCHIPHVDNPSRFIVENDPEGINDLYKTIAGDGRLLALPCEPTIALLNTLVLLRDETARYFGTVDSYSFQKPFNPQNGYYLTAVLTCANGYETEAEICGLALDVAEAIGVKGELRLGNTEIAQGIVDFYAQKPESKEKTQKVISGDVQSEGEFAAAQVFTDLKNINEANVKAYMQELSKRIDNKRSLDGVVDAYEVVNRLDAQGKTDGVILDPLYIGEEARTLGMVFSVGRDNPIIYGGRRIYVSGGESMAVITLTIDLFRLAAALNSLTKDQPRSVDILVADSLTAYQRALKFKADFLKNGLVSHIRYKVLPEEADAIMEKQNGKECLVVFIDEKGGLKHN